MSTISTLPTWVNAGRAWGMLVLAALFGVGGFFLFRRSFQDWNLLQEANTSAALLYGLYGGLGLIGLVKGEMIFRRKVMARSLSRARDAIGETGWAGDAPLAPFCMLSLYRPWKTAHAISSWVLIPIMVGLAFFFRFGLEAMGMDKTTAALIRGPVYFAIGIALIYGLGVYAVALVRFLGWWLGGAAGPIPLPAAEGR